MDWLYSLFIEHSALQAVVVLSLISAIGLGLGKIHICGISLGVTFVFFAGILAGHFGLSIDPQMLNYAESFGLVIFVYALGLQVGPGFFSSFRTGGVQLNMLAVGVVLIGTLMTLLGSYGLGVSLPDMVGILCGATTNTPALGAAQQTLKQMGIEANTPALGCAVAYPIGVVGVILGILMIRKALVRKADLEVKEKDDVNKPYIVAFQVHNPAIFNMSVKDIAQLSYPKFVISRLWRDGNVSIPTSEKVIKEGDRLLVITSERNVPALTVLFGAQENTYWNTEDIDWNAIDSQLISQRIVVTRPELNGKKLGSLHLRNHYGIEAVTATRGEVLMYAGTICDARFSKCCGGAFEEFQNCWENVKHPYLIGQRDCKIEDQLPDLTIETEADKWIRTSPVAFCHTQDKKILSQVLNNYDQETTDFYRWKVCYSQQELSTLIHQRSGIDFGQILDLIPIERGTSGRLVRLKIVGTLRTLIIGKELEIRRTLSTSHLYSSAFVIDKEYEEKGHKKDKNPSRFILTGAGWGHGVGLCQIGAAVMGEQGYKYEEILSHYYPGSTLEKQYQ